jgi:hypothetical protein
LVLPIAADCIGVKVEVELELTAGVGWGGARLYLTWQAQGSGGTTDSVSVYFEDHLIADGGLQILSVEMLKPAGYVAGSLPGYVRLRIFGTGNTDGHSRVENTTRIDRLNMANLTTAASSYINQNAIVDLEGNAAAALILRTKAGSSDGSVEISSLSDPAGGAASKIKMDADVIELVGDVLVGGDVKSSNFVTGVSGFRFGLDGTAEMQDLVVRSWLQDGAASDGGFQVDYLSGATIGNENLNVVMKSLSLGPTSIDQLWPLAMSCELRGTVTGDTINFSLRYRTKVSGVWSGWSVIYTSPTVGATGWARDFGVYNFVGECEDLEIGASFYPNRNLALWETTNVRNVSLQGRALIK